ncbi:MAG: class I SAM-dependent methyltransferase [Bryobacteraceae bacterium]
MSSVYLPSQVFQPKRYRPGDGSGHLLFANDLIAALRPRVLVELGTNFGASYFGFCQAIAESNVECRAYAVAPWTTDNQTGARGESVYSEVREYNEANYAAFSRLIQGEFDDAVSQFDDERIDLLHIRGLRTFEAASRAFSCWLPKVRPGGVVLLAGTATRLGDSGVSKLWGSLTRQGTTFEFPHDSGLGVFEKPGSSNRSEFLETLFKADKPLIEHIRRYYFLSAAELELRYNLAALSSEHERLLEEADIKQTRIYLLSDSHSAMKAGQREYAELHHQYEELEENYEKLEALYRQLTEEHESLKRTFQNVLSSHSWKLTSPLRAAIRAVKGNTG